LHGPRWTASRLERRKIELAFCKDTRNRSILWAARMQAAWA